MIGNTWLGLHEQDMGIVGMIVTEWEHQPFFEGGDLKALPGL